MCIYIYIYVYTHTHTSVYIYIYIYTYMTCYNDKYTRAAPAEGGCTA